MTAESIESTAVKKHKVSVILDVTEVVSVEVVSQKNADTVRDDIIAAIGDGKPYSFKGNDGSAGIFKVERYTSVVVTPCGEAA